MDAKDSLVGRLEAVFRRWEQYVAARSEQGLVAPPSPGDWSARDVIVHLMAWQQISNARMQAAAEDGEPRLPLWLGGADPFYAEDHTTEFNARILELYTNEPWWKVHRAWREGFLRLIEQSKALPERDMFDANRYPWLEGYAPSAVIAGSCDHHEEHLDKLLSASK